MYDSMDRSAIKAMHRRGISKSEIAMRLKLDRKTVRKILKGPAVLEYQRKPTGSKVDYFRVQILQWLEGKVSTMRMLEMARGDKENPYTGSRSAFYDRVKKFRREWKKDGKDAWIRFEGLPGEYVQVDWGEVRNFPFLAQQRATRYFFCARLKYSRYCYVEFTDNMRQETLIRCMLRAFQSFDGVPFISIFDNIKAVVIGRDDKKRPIWNETFLKFATEIDFHPEVCHPYSGNQKGSVENLVKWVKSNFLVGREFLDDEDLNVQCLEWLEKKNNLRSQAHGKIPAELLEIEREKFTPLMETASSYGIYGEVVVGPESLVNVDGCRYSVPVGYVGSTLTVRIRESRIDFYEDDRLAASHKRERGSRKPVIIPEHFEEVLKKKPRGRVMLYRDYLLGSDPSIEAYIVELCRRWIGTFGSHILKMYELLKDYGVDELGCACALASEHGAYGSDYLVALLRKPKGSNIISALEFEGIPSQGEIDRTLSFYEDFVRGGAP